MLTEPIKGSLRASFFLFVWFLFACNSAFARDAVPGWQHDRWLSLLHIKNGTPTITDPAFILTQDDFSPELEWRATLRLFAQQPLAICRFPARYRLLQESGASLPEFPDCPEYRVFLQRMPVDQVSVIYASENLTSPSSMLGHAMLAAEGVRDDGFYARHSVSFFTVLDSINPIKVLWETLIKGKEGFFLVKPLRAHFEFYNLAEQRNVWRYELDLDAGQRALLQDHLWELRSVKMDYFFHTQNCATVSADLIRLVIPQLTTGDWVTPIDLVKAVNRSGKIKSIEITPAAKWRVRMLEDTVPEELQDAVYQWQQGEIDKLPQVGGEDGFLLREMASAVLDYREQTGTDDTEQSRKKTETLRQSIPDSPEFSDYELTLDHYRSPLKTPEDAHYSFGYQRTEKTDWLSLQWLAVGHGIEDDNRQYFAENELKLFDLSLRASPQREALRLNHLQLYSARSLTPWDRFTGGVSGDFRVGFYSLADDNLQRQTAFNIHGGAGITLAASADLRVYALLNGGWYRNNDADFLYAEPEVGAYLYEVFGMKSWLRYQPRFAPDRKVQQQLTLTHSIALEGSALIAEVSRLTVDGKYEHAASVNWRWYF